MSQYRKKLLTEIMEADAKDGLYHIVDTNKMMTAVEWLFEQLVFKSDFEHLPNQYFLMSDKDIDKIIIQAKAMEKEQMETSFIEGAEMAKKVFKEELQDFLVLPKDYIN